MAHDTFTSTPEDAALFERMHGEEHLVDLPSPDELGDLPPLRVELCKAYQSHPDGSRTYCRLAEHDRTERPHLPGVTVPAGALAPGGWMQEPPF